MKRLLLILPVLLLTCVLFACGGEAEKITTADGLVLSPSADGTAYTLVDYVGAATDVTIPSHHEGLPITAIGVGAFAETSVTSVAIPESVTEIGIRAFGKCKSLTAITLPDSVKDLGRSAFSGCTALVDVTLSANLKALEENTFRDCTALTAITIPDKVTKIGGYAFSYCTKLSSITVGRGVQTIEADAFYKCNKLGSVIINDLAAWCRIEFQSNPLTIAGALFLGDELVTDLVIPEAIGCINDYAFAGCVTLQSITLHDDLYKLGAHAFDDCDYITSATVPAAVLGSLNTDALRSLTVLDGAIPADAFRGCTSLNTLVLADRVTEVGDGAFWGCYNLRSVTVGAGVSYIGDFAFDGCVQLCEVIDHSGFALIAGEMTDGGIARYAIEVHKGTSKLVTEGEYVFYATATDRYLVAYLGSDRDITLPEGAPYRIADYAFAHEQGLSTVVIPDAVTAIGNGAFSECLYLSSVYIGENVSLIGMSAFENCSYLEAVTFAATDGWYVVYIISATQGDPLTVTDPATNAQYLRSDYLYAFWKR